MTTTATRPTHPARQPAPTDADGALDWRDRPPLRPRPVVPAVPHAATSAAPALTPDAARQRFYDRYGVQLIGALLGGAVSEPQTVAEWYELAAAVRDVLAARQTARKRVRR